MRRLVDRWRGLRWRLRALLRREEVEAEVADELRFHVEMETEAGIGRGLDPREARRRALVRLGGMERYRAEARDVRRLGAWDALRQDLRQSLRLLAAHPGFAAAAILTLALGIGANTAVFSVVDGVLGGASPFAEPDRLVVVWETDRESDTFREPASWPDVADLRERSRTLAAIGVLAARATTLVAGGEAEPVTALAVTPDLPGILGVRPLVGRAFASDEGVPGGEPVVLLGEELWRSRFGGDRGVVGRRISLDEEPATVVGVLPAGADLGLRQIHDRADYAPSFPGTEVDVWVALRPTAEAYPRETHPFLTVARLAPGASLAAAGAELAGIAAELEEAHPVNQGRGVHLEPYPEVVFGPVRPALLVLLGAVALVLAVTCVNVANLLLARSTARSREVAVRSALGATTARLRHQFLVESAVLTALGAVAGLALAYGGLELLVALAPPEIPRLEAAAVDGRVLGYTAGIALLVTLAFGMVPTLQARRLDARGALAARSAGVGAGGGGGARFRSALVVAQIALAVTLVVGAGLLLRSFWRLQGVDPGFETERIVKARYQLPESRYPRDFSRWPDLPEIRRFHERFLEAVGALPGVESATVAGAHPLDPGFTNSFVIVGREAESADFPEIRIRFVGPGYLETVGLELLAGRDLRPGDDVRGAPVALLNRAAAERYFPDGDALGQLLGFWGTDRRIVGVVGNERFRGVDRAGEPAVYVPLAQNPVQAATLLVRAEGDPMALVPQIRSRLAELDPRLALFEVELLEATLAGSIARPRFTATIVASFAAVAILLALVGVYGVMSYSVARRRAEMALRMALGARRGTVLRGVVREGMGLVGVGLALGLAGALAGSRLLGGLVFGVTPGDPPTFLAVALLVVATAGLATAVPAWRAARADPARALRAE